MCINLANEFVARGHAVDMILLRADGELLPQLDPRVGVVDLAANQMRAAFRPLIRYLRLTRPAALLACMWPLTTVALAAHFVSRVSTRVVVAEHTTWSADRWYLKLMNRLVLSTTMRVSYPLAAGVVAVSEGAAEDLAQVGHLRRERVTPIYNPIVGGAEPTAAQEEPAVGWAIGPHRKILAVGRLKVIKDYPTLLRAFALLLGSSDARLLILGDGDERGALERMVVELGISQFVYMPGFSSNPAAFYRTADLLVLSSTGEGFGNVIVEALEAGTPVVSTDCPSGPREILGDGRYGTLVPVGEPEALASAMHAALSRTHDGALLKSRAAEFSVTKAADAYLDLLLPDRNRRLSASASTVVEVA